MGNIKIGDIVTRKSYDNDITFKVVDINESSDQKICILKGTYFRLMADSQESDLTLSQIDCTSDIEVQKGNKKKKVFTKI